MNISKVESWRMAALAFYLVKFASLIESPAKAQAKRVASAPYYVTASIKLMKFPVDLDIFSPSTKI
jgi:hypothetical protein